MCDKYPAHTPEVLKVSKVFIERLVKLRGSQAQLLRDPLLHNIPHLQSLVPSDLLISLSLHQVRKKSPDTEKEIYQIARTWQE